MKKDKLINQIAQAGQDIQPDSSWLSSSLEHVEIQVNARQGCLRPALKQPLTVPAPVPRARWRWTRIATVSVASIAGIVFLTPHVPALQALGQRSLNALDAAHLVPPGVLKHIEDYLEAPLPAAPAATSSEATPSSSTEVQREPGELSNSRIDPRTLPAAVHNAQNGKPDHAAPEKATLPILPPTASATATAAVLKTRTNDSATVSTGKPTTTPAAANSIDAKNKTKTKP